MGDAPQTPAVLVTGGTGAIGSAICELLSERGQGVAFTYREDHEARDRILERFEETGTPAMAQSLDLTDAPAVAGFVDNIFERWGSLTTVIHASGPNVPQRFVSQLDGEELMKHIDDELLSFFNLVLATLPHLRAQGGSITAVTTVATKRFIKRDGLSSVPKAAVEGMVRALAAEEGRFDVRVNCVGPGILNEGMALDLMATGEFNEAAQQCALREIALGRFGSAKDVAELVCFLASNNARYITGQKIDVDGGYSL